MRWARLLLPAFVVLSGGAGIAALNFAPSPQSKTPVPTVPSKPPELAAVAKPAQTTIARDVGGGALTAPILPDAPLERIAPVPLQKHLEVFGPPMPQLGKEEPFLLFQPIVENAGTLITEGRTITLAGVLPVEFNRVCTAPDGQLWPCGRKARTEFRALVRGRAISCFLPDQQKIIVEAECSIGRQNLGEWLVEKGWAQAQPGSELESLGKAAKLMDKGIYGGGT